MKSLMLARLVMAVGFAVVGFGVAQAQPFQTVGQDMKGAGHDTADASKTVAHKTVSGTKTGYHKTVHGTRKGYHKTVHATKTGYHKTATGTTHLVHKVDGK